MPEELEEPARHQGDYGRVYHTHKCPVVVQSDDDDIVPVEDVDDLELCGQCEFVQKDTQPMTLANKLKSNREVKEYEVDGETQYEVTELE